MKSVSILSKENAAKIIFGICAAFSIFAVFAIIIFVLYQSIPAFRAVGVLNFLFGSTWLPGWEDRVPEGGAEYSQIFGIAPMIITSLVLTFGAVLLGGLFGVFTAVFMAYYCPEKLGKLHVFSRIPLLRNFPLKGFFRQVINLLASIPSIVIGFFGLVVIVPLIRDMSPNQNGTGVLSAVIVLSLMIVPTVSSLSQNSLEAVPKEYYEGSLGLGNTKDQTVFRTMVPAAKSGILSALILGIGRAVGEAMAVYFVIGGTPGKFPDSLFKPVSSLTVTIVEEMGYASDGSIHKSALIASGFVLLVFVLLINLLLNFIKKDKVGGNSLFSRNLKASAPRAVGYTYRQTGIGQSILRAVSIAFAFIILFALGYLVVFIAVKGIPYLTPQFLFGESSNANVTLAPAFVTTGMIIALTLLIALPLGIGAAIFLNEYSKKGSKFVKTIRLFIDTLAGVPSIVFGLFGMIFFCGICNLNYSIAAGSFTMVLIILPTIIRSTEESLREVPDAMREGALALGSSKVRTIFKIVLPLAIRGIATSVVLSIGRIVGESAALIYTSGSTIRMPNGYGSTGSTFAVLMYRFQVEPVPGLGVNAMYATAVVLLVIVLCLNILVTALQKNLGKGGKEKKPKKESVRLKQESKAAPAAERA